MDKCNYCGVKPIPIGRRKYCSDKCNGRAKTARHYKKHGKGKGICSFCERPFIARHKNKQKYCSIICASNARKKYLTIPDCLENASRKIDKNIGYVRVYAPMHPETNTRGYVYEHRIIAEQKIGRRLKRNEIVHHLDGIRWNNELKNLKVMDRIKHCKLQGSTEPLL